MRARQAQTFEDFATGWLRDRPLKPRTRDGYQHLLDKYPITPTAVRSWWSKSDPGTPTVNARARMLLKSIFNTAVEDELMTVNPCRIGQRPTLSAASGLRCRAEALRGIAAELDVLQPVSRSSKARGQGHLC